MPDISWIVKEKNGCLIQKVELWDIQYCVKFRGWFFFHKSQEENNKTVKATVKYWKSKLAMDFYEL